MKNNNGRPRELLSRILEHCARDLSDHLDLVSRRRGLDGAALERMGLRRRGHSGPKTDLPLAGNAIAAIGLLPCAAPRIPAYESQTDPAWTHVGFGIVLMISAAAELWRLQHARGPRTV